MVKYDIPDRHRQTKWVVDHYKYLNYMDEKLSDEQKICNSELTKISTKYKNTTDKGPLSAYQIKHNYTELYNFLLKPYKDLKINLLEIGVRDGGSLMMWHDFLPKAQIYGIDIIHKNRYYSDRIHLFTLNAYNITDINNQMSNLKFDIIIDDGSHVLADQIKMINIWYSKLNLNGILIIEDIQNINNAKEIIKNFIGPINRCSIIDRTHCIPSLDDINVVYYA